MDLHSVLLTDSLVLPVGLFASFASAALWKLFSKAKEAPIDTQVIVNISEDELRKKGNWAALFLAILIGICVVKSHVPDYTFAYFGAMTADIKDIQQNLVYDADLYPYLKTIHETNQEVIRCRSCTAADEICISECKDKLKLRASWWTAQADAAYQSSLSEATEKISSGLKTAFQGFQEFDFKNHSVEAGNQIMDLIISFVYNSIPKDAKEKLGITESDLAIENLARFSEKVNNTLVRIDNAQWKLSRHYRDLQDGYSFVATGNRPMYMLYRDLLNWGFPTDITSTAVALTFGPYGAGVSAAVSHLAVHYAKRTVGGSVTRNGFGELVKVPILKDSDYGLGKFFVDVCIGPHGFIYTVHFFKLWFMSEMLPFFMPSTGLFIMLLDAIISILRKDYGKKSFLVKGLLIFASGLRQLLQGFRTLNTVLLIIFLVGQFFGRVVITGFVELNEYFKWVVLPHVVVFWAKTQEGFVKTLQHHLNSFSMLNALQLGGLLIFFLLNNVYKKTEEEQWKNANAGKLKRIGSLPVNDVVFKTQYYVAKFAAPFLRLVQFTSWCLPIFFFLVKRYFTDYINLAAFQSIGTFDAAEELGLWFFQWLDIGTLPNL